MVLQNNSIYVQEVAEAISAILNIDVTIINKDLFRIAATGNYKSLIGEQLPKRCSYENIFKSKKPESIIEKTLSEKCKDCISIENCYEIANIGYPIFDENKNVIGVIGLIAFKKEQKKYIDANFTSINLFLKKLSSLLSGNLKYEETIKDISLKNEEFENIVNSIDNGIILTDKNFNILTFNKNLLSLFDCSSNCIKNKSIYDIFNQFSYEGEEKEYIYFLNENISSTKDAFVVKIMKNYLNEDNKSFIFKISSYSKDIIDAYNIIERDTEADFDSIIGESFAIRNTITLAKQVANSFANIMLIGETGTGKELFARSIHNISNRKNSHFITLDCGLIANNSFESELFGYEDNSFKLSNFSTKIGKLELANNGSLFINKVEKLPLHLQPKILSALENGYFYRLGSNRKIKTNVRIISSTTEDLESLVKNNLFLEGLYYKLNVIPINIPPLRERNGDIELIAKAKVKKYCEILNKNDIVLSDDLLDVFNRYNWKGNVRELENIIEYLVNVSESKFIGPDMLPNFFNSFNLDSLNILPNGDIDMEKEVSLQDLTENFEKQILINYINKYGKSTKAKQKIANLLQINLSTLYRKLYRYEII